MKKVTDYREWRKAREQGYTLILPSGNVVRVRPIALDVLILKGQIPDFLFDVAGRVLFGDMNEATLTEQAGLLKRFVELMNEIVPLAMLEPKVRPYPSDLQGKVDDPPLGDNEISLDDIDFSDKYAIFQLAMQPNQVLEAISKAKEQQNA